MALRHWGERVSFQVARLSQGRDVQGKSREGLPLPALCQLARGWLHSQNKVGMGGTGWTSDKAACRFPIKVRTEH